MLGRWPRATEFGGVAAHMRGLVPKIGNLSDVELTVMSFVDPKDSPDSVDFDFLGLPRRVHYYAHPAFSRLALARAIQDLDPDIVHLQGINISPYGLWFARDSKFPKVVTAHSIPSDEWRLRDGPKAAFMTRVSEIHHRRVVRAAHSIIAVGDDLKDSLSTRYSKSLRCTVRVISNGVELSGSSVERSRPRSDEDGLVGVTVAGLVPIKRLTLLLEAVRIARQSVPALTWKIVGGGPLRDSLEQYRDELGLHDAVEFVGPRPHDEVTEFLRGADVFALTSKYETFSIATVEAMAAGIPVVLSGGGNLRRLASDSGAGRWVESDPAMIAESIVDILTDSRRKSALGAAGRTYAERYRWENVAQETLAVYQDALRAF